MVLTKELFARVRAWKGVERGDSNVKKTETSNSNVKKYPNTIKKLTEKYLSAIADDISDQLIQLSKFGKYYDDLVNEYLSLLTIREALKQDIQTQGVRYKFINGNGKEQEKANESVTNLIKIEQILLKIVNDLGINQPFVKSSQNDNSQTKNNIASGDSNEEDLL